MKICFGVVRNGKIELEAGSLLPEGASVRVELAGDADPIDGLEDEAVETGIADLATAHDRYAYGIDAQDS